MTDVLGAVNDFVLTYVSNNEVGLLTQPQVFRGWQNVVSVGPQTSQEYAVLTLLASVRHGTNVHLRQNAAGDTGMVETVSRMAEHMVQVDFCCAYPQQSEEVARTRAEILEMLTRDRVAIKFFGTYGFSACFADDIRPLPFQNEAEQWVARYSVTMHLSGWTACNIYLPTFEEVGLYLENVDVHHIPKDVPPKPKEYTVENVNDANEGTAFSYIVKKEQ